MILYVGKAKNLKNRVRSYFQPVSKLGVKTARLVERIHSIEYIEVGSETEALLLESRLIKKFKPFYNLAAKDDKSPYYIHLSKEEYPRPILNHESENSVAGPFLNAQIPRKILRGLRRIAPYCTGNRPLKRPCFYSHLGLCHPCPGANNSQTAKEEYRKNISRLKRLLSGEFVSVRKQLNSEMNQAAKVKDYESAGKIRDQVQALDFLLAVPISADEYLVNPNLTQDLRQESLDALQATLQDYIPALRNVHLSRIEMYDMAHLAGTAATGAMTVAVDGEINSKNFRHFKIRTRASNSDVDMMREVLTRRLKRSDWPQPDLIILDGGKSQLSILSDIHFPCPVISLAKREETLVIPGENNFLEITLDKSHPGLKLLQRLRDEAHRFSRRLHHKYRSLKNPENLS